MYSVTNSNNTFSLSGTITINESTQVENFNGSITKDSKMYGNFYYSETSDGKINFNLSNVSTEFITEVEQFIVTTVNEVKNDNK